MLKTCPLFCFGIAASMELFNFATIPKITPRVILGSKTENSPRLLVIPARELISAGSVLMKYHGDGRRFPCLEYILARGNELIATDMEVGAIVPMTAKCHHAMMLHPLIFQIAGVAPDDMLQCEPCSDDFIKVTLRSIRHNNRRYTAKLMTLPPEQFPEVASPTVVPSWENIVHLWKHRDVLKAIATMNVESAWLSQQSCGAGNGGEVLWRGYEEDPAFMIPKKMAALLSKEHEATLSLRNSTLFITGTAGTIFCRTKQKVPKIPEVIVQRTMTVEAAVLKAAVRRIEVAGNKKDRVWIVFGETMRVISEIIETDVPVSRVTGKECVISVISPYLTFAMKQATPTMKVSVGTVPNGTRTVQFTFENGVNYVCAARSEVTALVERGKYRKSRAYWRLCYALRSWTAAGQFLAVDVTFSFTWRRKIAYDKRTHHYLDVKHSALKVELSCAKRIGKDGKVFICDDQSFENLVAAKVYAEQAWMDAHVAEYPSSYLKRT